MIFKVFSICSVYLMMVGVLGTLFNTTTIALYCKHKLVSANYPLKEDIFQLLLS